MNNNEENILKVEHLQKSYGDHKVLRDISFDINKGEIMTIIGPSGGGKSTMLRCINLLEDPTEGKILFHGDNILAPKYDLNHYRSKVGMVFQQFNLFNNKNVLQNCMIGQESVLGRSKNEAEKVARENLKKVGMEAYAEAKPAQLSGGQQQRVAIARAISMDPEMVGEVLKTMSNLAKTGLTMVIVTHEMGFARDISNHVVFMSDGFITEQGTPDQIFNHPQEEKTKKFLRNFRNEQF